MNKQAVMVQTKEIIFFLKQNVCSLEICIIWWGPLFLNVLYVYIKMYIKRMSEIMVGKIPLLLSSIFQDKR